MWSVVTSGWFYMMLKCFRSEPDLSRPQTQMVYRCFYQIRGEELDLVDTKHTSVSVTQLGGHLLKVSVFEH